MSGKIVHDANWAGPVREELAWAAGFFDGEGNVTVHPRQARRGPRALVQISQSGDTTLLERFQRAVGVGQLRGPYVVSRRFYGGRLEEQEPRRFQDSYQYGCSNREGVQHIACVLWQFLGDVKREQFRHALTLIWRG